MKTFFLQLLSTLAFVSAKDYADYIETTVTEEGSILLLGDSWAAISGDYAANICGLKTTRLITNDAENGSTANEWAEKETAVESMTKAEYDYEYVWLSLGGNDFLDNKCDIDMAEEVAADIVTVIGQVVDNSPNENIKILYLGYAVPSDDVCGNGMTSELFEAMTYTIFGAIKASDYAKYVTLHDISEMFMPWGSNLSDEYYFYDDIHLNEIGYMHLFSSYKVQRFFGCSAAQTLEVKTISGVAEAKQGHVMSVVGSIITTLVGMIMLTVGIVLAVKFVKQKIAEANSDKAAALVDPKESDYVVVKNGKKAEGGAVMA